MPPPRPSARPLWLALALLVALVPRVDAQRYRTTTLSERDGMPSHDVQSMLQHPDGSLWFGVRAMLLRYDGQSFQSYPEPREGGVAAWLTVDRRGSVWSASTQLGHGIVQHSPEGPLVFGRPAGAPDSAAVLGLHALADGQIALVTARAGVFLRSEDGLWLRPDGRPEGRTWASTHTPTGLYVVGDSGLSRLRHGRWTHGLAAAAGLPDEHLVAVVGGEAGRIWVAGDAWVGYLSGLESRVLYTDTSLELDTHARFDGRGPVLLPDGAGGVWIGSSGLLLRIDRSGEFERLDRSTGLSGQGASSMLRDRDGNTWIASARGVSRISSLRFLNYDHRDGLLSDEVSALIEHPRGGLVVGHNQGISILTEQGVRVILPAPEGLSHHNDTRVLDLARDLDGTLWIARSRSGLQSLSPDHTLTSHPLSGRPDGYVSGVTVDAQGTLWIGAEDGLWRRKPGGAFEQLPCPLMSAKPYVRRVFADKNRLWLATLGNGVVELRDGEWHQYLHPTDPLANSVYAVYEQPSGSVLVGTKAGLFELVDGALARPRLPSQQIEMPIYFLLPEPSGRLWVGGQSGLIRLGLDGRRDYGLEQGLPGLEVNRAAACVDSRGRVWLGSVNGLSAYQEQHDHEAQATPTVQLASLEVGQQTFDLNQGAEVALSSGDLTFRFGATTFLGDGRAHFQYRLDGHDDDWIDHHSRNLGTVSYSGIPPGSYTFSVRARAARGPWSEAVGSAPVVLVGPWWQQLWFRGLTGALILGVLLALNRSVNQRRRADELELLVKQRTRALSSAEHRYREMFRRNVMAQILVSPQDGRVRAANPAAEREWEVPPQGLDGRPLAELLHEPPSALLAKLLAVHAGDVLSATARRRPADGDLRQLELEACAYELDGSLSVHLSVRDVTERLAVEAQLTQAQKMESVGRLAGGVAHDFNNMLTAVLGHADQARHNLSEPDIAREHLTELMGVARRGAELTSQLLGFAREQPTAPQALCPGDFVNSLRSLLHRLVRDDVVLDVDVDPDAGNVCIDPIQLEQVLINLVVNGADAMPQGGPLVVTVARGTPDDRPRENTEPEHWLRLSVSDTGIGMPEEVSRRIFEPFFSTKPAGQGTGLGLATCHGILRQNGGLIEVVSQPGSGSSFHVLLPRVDQPAVAVLGGIEELDAPDRAQQPSSLAATILLVEDEQIVRSVAATALRREGHEVIEAGDGGEALSCEQEHGGAIDLLLTDVIMPGMGGCELAELLLERRPRVAVLYTSGYTSDALPELEARPGHGELLAKPYRLEELGVAVESALRRSGSPANA